MITDIKYRPLASLKKHPGNPRTIKDASFKKLVQSIDENPDYFEARPIILSERTGELIIIAGNQRYAAAKEIGIKDVPTVVLPALTEEKEREIMIRDNISNGDWDFDILSKDWDADLLNEWGLSVPVWGENDPQKEWQDMPGFNSEDITSKYQLIVHFESLENKIEFSDLIGCKLTEKTKSITWPEKIIDKVNDLRY